MAASEVERCSSLAVCPLRKRNAPLSCVIPLRQRDAPLLPCTTEEARCSSLVSFPAEAARCSSLAVPTEEARCSFCYVPWYSGTCTSLVLTFSCFSAVKVQIFQDITNGVFSCFALKRPSVARVILRL